MGPSPVSRLTGGPTPVAAPLALIPLRPSKCLDLLQHLFTVEYVRPQSPARHVIKMEVFGRPVREPDLEAAGVRYSFA